MFCHFKSFLNEMDEIIRTTTERGGKSIIYAGFSYRVDRARPGDKVIDWRCRGQRIILECRCSCIIRLTEGKYRYLHM